MSYLASSSRSIHLLQNFRCQYVLNTRVLQTARYSQKTDATSANAQKQKSEAEEDGVSEWIRKLHEYDRDRPPIIQKYRRQNYDHPYERAFGILADDLRIFYHKVRYFFGMFGYLVFTKEGRDKLRNIEIVDDMKKPESREDLLVTDSQHMDLIVKKKKEQKKSFTAPLRKLIAPIQPNIFPSHADVVIVGGGAIGSSIAYHLKKNSLDSLNIVMVEKDSTYKEASTVLSVGGIRHQFSLPENILLSMYGMEFMQDIPRLLAIDGVPPPSVNFQPHGYLTLASEKGLPQLRDCHYIQKYFDARVKYLEPSELKQRFPWMNIDGIGGGIIGTENEGWFDPWSLLMGLRRKAVNLGVKCLEGEVHGFELKNDLDNQFVDCHPSNAEKKITDVKIRMANGEEQVISTAVVILATGPSTGQLCYDTLGIGAAKEGIMAYPIPIEPKKRYVYSFHAPKGPGISTPLVIDPTGAYFRREGLGNMYIAGLSPEEHLEPPCDNLEVDHDYFTNEIWPILANRVPAFEELKVQGSWAGFYEMNIFDQNGIIGTHPIVSNLIIAGGFSGHGIQHSLGVGRAVMELFLAGEFQSIDLSRFACERIIANEPIYEVGIV